jgi:hypothetical protein
MRWPHIEHEISLHVEHEISLRPRFRASLWSAKKSANPRSSRQCHEPAPDYEGGEPAAFRARCSRHFWLSSCLIQRAATAQEVKQIKLTEKHIQSFITAYKDMTRSRGPTR